MTSRTSRALSLGICAVALAAVVQIAGRPGDYVRKDLVIDDAVYYAKTAMQFVAGHGYAIDGLHRSYGVQPLWAIVVTGLAYLVRDPDALLRAMVLASGFGWVVGGWLLSRLLRPLGGVAAFTTLLVWLMAGFEVRLAMMGMENGLCGLVLGLSLTAATTFAATAVDAPEWRRRALWFGVATGLQSLVRVEYGLLAVSWGLWVVWRARGAGWRPACRRALPFLVPVAVLAGAWVGFARVYFGEWTPVSGAVKAWNAQEAGPGTPFVASFVENLGRSAWLSLSGIAISLYEVLVPRLQRLPTNPEWAIGLGVCALPLATRVPALFRPSTWSPNTAPRLLWALFALVHLVLLSWLLAPFAAYCTWYFTSEIAIVALCVGAVVGRLGRWWRVLLAVPLVAVVVASAALRVPTWFEAKPTNVTAPYVDIGRWLEDWLPPGSRIGCFASGYVSLEAESHRVTNLDGLINDGAYFRDYVQKHRIPDYFADEQIGYFADNLPPAQWRSYARNEQPMLPAGLRPLHAWPGSPTEVVGIVATPSAATGAPAHPLGAAYFRALVLGELPTLADGELGTLAADRQVVASYLVPPTGELRHVTAPRAEVGRSVDPAGVQHLGTASVEFGGRVRLLGHDAVAPSFRCGGAGLVRVYLQACGGDDGGVAYEVGLRIGAAGAPPACEVVQRLAHGTQPAGNWPGGELRAHCFAVRPAVALPSGRHDVWFAIRPVGGEWLAPGATATSRDGFARIGTLAGGG